MKVQENMADEEQAGKVNTLVNLYDESIDRMKLMYVKHHKKREQLSSARHPSTYYVLV